MYHRKVKNLNERARTAQNRKTAAHLTALFRCIIAGVAVVNSSTDPGPFTLLNFVVRTIGLTVLYVLVALSGLSLATPPGYSSFVFPAAGIAVAAVMIGGYRHCLGVALGAMIIAVVLQRTINPADTQLVAATTAIGLGAATALQAAVARYLVLRVYGADLAVNRPAKIIGICLLAGPIACLTSSSLGTLLLVWVGDLQFSGSLFQWFVRWLGDWVGVMLVIPFLIVWATRPFADRWRRMVWVALPILLGFAASLGGYAYLNQRERASGMNEFNVQSDGLNENVAKSFDQHVQAVHELSNAASLAKPHESDVFHVLTQSSLERWPGLVCVTWHPLIQLEDRAEFEDGPNGAAIVERGADGKFIRAVDRDYYLPGLVIGSPKFPTYESGSDLAVDPIFADSHLQVTSVLEPAVTGRMKWKSDKQQGFGMAVVQPVFGGEDMSDLAGVVVGFFELEALVQHTDNHYRWRGVHLRILDTNAKVGESLLYSNIDAPPSGEQLQRVRHYHMPNRDWKLVVTPTERTPFAKPSRASSWVLSLGVIMTSMLGCMFVLGIGREATIQQQVDKKENELRKVNETLSKQLDRLHVVDRVLDRERNLLRTLIDMLRSEVYVTDLEGRFLINNNAHLAKLALPDQESAIGFTLAELGWPNGEASLSADLSAIETGVGHYDREEKMRDRDGAPTWKLNTRLPLRDGDGVIVGMVAVSHDVTDRKQIEQSLVETDQRMRLALKSARAGTWNWRFRSDRFSGDRFLSRLLNCEPETSIDRLDEFLAHVDADDRQQVRKHIETAAAGDAPLSTEFRVQTADSEIVYIAVRGHLETDELNGESVLAGVCWDITREKRAELALAREQHLFATLVEHVPDVIYFKNRESQFIRVNKAAYEYIGVQEESQLIGKTDHDFFEAKYAQSARVDELAIMETGKPIVGREEREESVDGTVRWVLTTKLPLYDEQGAIVGTCGISRDITPIKRQSELLTERKKELETLLHVSSHDLREPMNSILNFSHRLKQGAGDQLDADGLDSLTRIIGGAERMNSLLVGVADMFSAQTSISPDETVNGKSLIQPALEALAEEIETTNATVKVHGEFPDFLVDRKWVEKAIYELVSNGLKFVAKDAPPCIEIAPYQVGNDVGIIVSDHGPGVRPQHAQNIFNLFKRTVGRSIVGTGAGLAIVAQVAKQHQGRTWVEPREGGGSRFIITLAATPASDSPDEA